MKNTKPFFTIVIPTLNEEQYVPNILSDLAAQTNNNFEVIVVDGTSHDATVKKVEQFASLLSISILLSKKRNLSYQRNRGASVAQGTYLVFVDADARIPKGFLQTLYGVLKKRKYLLALPYIDFDASVAYLHPFVGLINASIDASQMLPRPLVTGGLIVIERNFYHHLGGFTVRRTMDKKKFFPEDVDLLVRAKKAGVITKKLPKPSYIFSIRRFKQEGALKVVLKYFISTIDFTNGDITAQVPYEMGGHIYKKQP
ncbi:MAG: glycosyltransferase [Candidatus Roizmanbacteria bacterium]|nr:glycosyltransferase [Candidatus Roizmanbacteria bacterium]